MCLLLVLGTWQLLRGLDKAQIEQRYIEPSKPLALSARTQNWTELDYRPAHLIGDWQWEREFLLENRIHQGQPGYEVLTPFELAHDKALVLVNRGWVGNPEAVGASTPWGDENPHGVLYRPNPGFTLGPTVSGEVRWPQTVLYLDIAALSDHLGRKIEAAVLVLDPAHPAAYTRIWQPVALSASRHYGYAIQWWGLALTLLVLGCIWRRKAH